MKRKVLIGAGTIIILLVVYFIIKGGKSSDTSAILITVEKGMFQVEVETTGELEAKNSVKIYGPRKLRAYRIHQVKIDKIIEEGIKTPQGTIDLIQRIEELASNSDTGKITIVAHSMGGLLGKAIIKKLENSGKENLIDSFVMIGTPQLGTPQAVATILHGDGEGIWCLHGNNLSDDSTRNLPSFSLR